MEKYRFVTTIKKDLISYDFVGFDDWTDFDKIVHIVEDRIKPNLIDYHGWTDMHGYFEKDGLQVNIEYYDMGLNYLEFKGEQTERNKSKVKKWAQLIFDELMAGLE